MDRKFLAIAIACVAILAGFVYLTMSYFSQNSKTCNIPIRMQIPNYDCNVWVMTGGSMICVDEKSKYYTCNIVNMKCSPMYIEYANECRWLREI